MEAPTNTIGNPHGDYEFENLRKSLAKLSIRKTAGRAIKIVAPYIDNVPLDRPVKVIFMKRDFSEIVASLLAMKVIWESGPEKSVPRAVRWLEDKGIKPLFVELRDLLKYPKTVIAEVGDFIGIDFDQAGALKALDRDPRRGVNKLEDGKGLIYFAAQGIN